jgi:large subunit ribosomal protein L10
MTREEKNNAIEALVSQLSESKVVYLADIAGLNAEKTSQLRKLCYSKGISLSVVKNTLLAKAMERSDKDFGELSDVLKGSTSMMLSETGNAPARVIKDFSKKAKIPVLKGAWIDEAVFIGADHLESLTTLKSKEELIGDIIMLLQSPAKNVISALQSGGNKLSGIVKTLSERAE